MLIKILFSIKALSLSVIAMLLAVYLISPAQAAIFYIKPGESRTVKTERTIGTVFVSNPDIADYKVVGEHSVVVYAKSLGYADLIIYDSDENIIVSHSLEVDPIIPTLHYRIKTEFPGSDIKISRFLGGLSGQKASYLLTGIVPDEMMRDKIYNIVGSAVGTGTREDYKLTERDTGDELFDFRRYGYENIINEIRLAKTNQINVKLTLVEVSKEFTDVLGIEWQTLTLNSLLGEKKGFADMGIVSLLGLKNGLDINNIGTIIRAVQDDKLAKVLAEPNLTVLSGEKASFLVGGEIPIVSSQSETSESMRTSLEYKPYGIQLNIAAKVENGEKIRLYISSELSSIAGNYSFSSFQIPILSTRRAQSTIEVSDGDSFVIGGLLNEQDYENLTRIPFISDIPILGALARTTNTTRRRTELVVFATVNLVSPNSSFEQVRIPHLKRTDFRNIFFNVKSNHDNRVKSSIPFTDESERFMSRTGFLE